MSEQKRRHYQSIDQSKRPLISSPSSQYARPKSRVWRLYSNSLRTNWQLNLASLDNVPLFDRCFSSWPLFSIHPNSRCIFPTSSVSIDSKDSLIDDWCSCRQPGFLATAENLIGNENVGYIKNLGKPIIYASTTYYFCVQNNLAPSILTPVGLIDFLRCIHEQ